MSRLQRAALAYGKMGLKIFPCRAMDKPPAIKGWQSLATTNTEIITKWWTQHPNWNIGLPGRENDLIIFDLDNKNDLSGTQSWADLRKELSLTIHTWTAYSPNNGMHLVFKGNGLQPGNSASKLGPGIDVRDNGFVCVAPSVIDTGTYRWDMAHHPLSTDIQVIPDALAKRLYELKNGTNMEPKEELPPAPTPASIPEHINEDYYASLATQVAVGMVQAAVDGQKHEVLYRAAVLLGGYVAGGIILQEHAYSELHEAIEKMDGVRSMEQASKTIYDGLAAGAASPITLEDKLREREQWLQENGKTAGTGQTRMWDNLLEQGEPVWA